MSPPRLFVAACVAFLFLIVFLIAGLGWFLYGPNQIDSAELVPANSLFFASIPNGTTILQGYYSSKAKSLVDNPTAKPLVDMVTHLLGPKNLDLIQTFLPNLSGQSFIAVTHYDPAHPEQIGLIAAMKPKAGFSSFDSFLAKVKETYAGTLNQGQIGQGTVDGVNYDWIRGPGATDKICVARIKGWIVVTWGETTLQDWLERFRHKPATASLAQDSSYTKAVSRVGEAPMTLVYLNVKTAAEMAQKEVAKQNPEQAAYMAKELESLGGAAVGTRFENGDIVDRFSFTFPKSAQVENGMVPGPCAFDTLKFTGPNTRFYWASNVDWKHYYEQLKGQKVPVDVHGVNPAADQLLTFLQMWAGSEKIDAEKNIFDALGSEISVQVDWNKDETFPEAGLLVKVEKPDDFKPTIDAIKDTVKKAYGQTSVIQELDANGQKLYALQFVPPAAVTPTMTETGPYFGIFVAENQAVRSFKRDANLTLDHRVEFTSQIGDQRNNASQIVFLDSPAVLNHAYQAAMPYLSIASMFNKDLAAAIQGKSFPENLDWLAPMGTWSCVVKTDDDGIEAYSISGIGNQGLFFSGALGGAGGVLQSIGYLPHVPAFSPAPAPTAVAPTNVPPQNIGTPPTASTNAAPVSSTNSDATPPPPHP